MLNVRPFLVRFARSPVELPEKPKGDPEKRRNGLDLIQPPTTIFTKVNGETTDDN